MSNLKYLLYALLLISAGIIVFLFIRNDEEATLGESCLSLYTNITAANAAHPGETDYELYTDLKVPPLSPDQALERFELKEGFNIELAAHEPMVIDPVAMDIDADGRLWVINMPAYNAGNVREILETTGERTEERAAALRALIEDAPKGNVVVLEDTNGDGKMDSHKVFYEDVLLPRSIKVLNDGILLGAPPNLLFIRDTTGDGKGDSEEIISSEYTTPRSPQSGPSALFWAMDNWIHNSHFPSIRRVDGQWQTKIFPPLGQWDMAQDDWGRLYSSSNSWPLHAHLVPYGYSDRHPFFELTSGNNARIAPHEPMWPAHPTGVNRGYNVGDVTREDGTLRIGAGISSTVIYRGDQFGEEYRGNAFTPVASGNLIKRMILDSDPAEIDAEARFAYENREFLTSTDERFRPVNIYNAPDGSIYVVDLYRGLYDYILWVTDYLAEYTLERDLEVPTGKFGRIYRIYREDEDRNVKNPRFSQMTASEVAAYLRHENGFLRDQAQQVLAMCSPGHLTSGLEEMALNHSEKDVTRLHALWTLEGFDRSVYSKNQLTETAVLALQDSHPRIRAAALRILEPEIAANSGEILSLLEELNENEEAPYVKLQLLASLGESDSEQSLSLMAAILDEYPDSPYFREMALTGIYHREEPFKRLLQDEFGWNAGDREEFGEFFAKLDEAIEERPGGIPDHLTEEEAELYNRGQLLYSTCSACHGAEGQGMAGVGTALAGSEWVNDDPAKLVRIVLHGFDGGAAEQGENIPNDMPGHAFLPDDDVAAILTYMRQSWGNNASPVEPGVIHEIRSATSDRRDIWTPDELRGLQD
jgi:mono/diheme cytochrome c family protein